MNLQAKIAAFFGILACCLIASVLAIGLFSFRQYSIATATEHIRSSAEMLRVSLTEEMINGVIAKRESLLVRMLEVEGLKSVRIVRGPQVAQQFGKGLLREQSADEIERRVLGSGQAEFGLVDATGEGESEIIFRGTIPYIATNRGSPNCLMCHQVAEGTVLGAVTITMSIDHLKRKAILTLSLMVAAVTLFSLVTFFLLRRLTYPIVETATHVEKAVQRALEGDFKSQIVVRTDDEIGHIAGEMNRLLNHLDNGLNRINDMVTQLTNHAPNDGNGNLLNSTIEMVETLTEAAHFKQAIEEDETKSEIYIRLSGAIAGLFDIHHYSIYEVLAGRKQMMPVLVDGQIRGPCSWCDPQILVRNETCRARRTGHIVNSIATPDICFAFKPPEDLPGCRHICFPIIQSGTVGSVLQLLAPAAELDRIDKLVPYISVYLREAAPVLEAKRLTETLRESNLRDPMTGLHNRRFLEESVEMLVAQSQRHKSPLSILMLDLDYFKMVNDVYGHDVGDTVLKVLAKLLAESVRTSDYVIRYGGEEFLILLQDTDAAAATDVAEKIRAAVEDLKVQVASGMLQKTISIGISALPDDSDTFWQAVKFADVALYHAKETGRNRVVRFTKDLWEKQDNKKNY
ncbi:MAG: diguanylate cyclase [Proteobacteria bacterium]|nr:diguanylate cyclase [Pseudomonadota bacterium]